MYLPKPFASLSARLLVLTMFFVMLSEVLIYLPSIARFRMTYLQDRLADAHIAALALEATPARALGPELERRLLEHAQAYMIELKTGDTYTHMLGGSMPPKPDIRFDLRRGSFVRYIREALSALTQRDNRVLHVTGASRNNPNVEVEIIIDEEPMRRAMLAYSERILQLSILISLLTATLVYLSLRWLLVRPMQRLTEAMMRFRENPEDQARIIRPGPRNDEIGTAERELAQMQAGLRAALVQRARLAALGEAVTRINHDLRNMLASAQLLSDRLEASEDPEVRRVTPTLFRAIDRAVALCARVLDYARSGAPNLRPSTFPLAELVADAAVSAGPGGDAAAAVAWETAVPAGLIVRADREQLFRVLVNLGRNAVEAGARRVRIAAEAQGDWVSLTVADDGPGLPAKARERLFQPFSGSAKAAGSGLGLAIARELLHAHGGEISLVETGPEGTVFRLDLPLRTNG